MGTKVTEEQAKQEGGPLIFGSQTDNTCVDVGVHVGVCICVIDNYAGLLCVLNLFNLASAMGAHNGGRGDFSTTVFAKLSVLLSNVFAAGCGCVLHVSLPFNKTEFDFQNTQEQEPFLL